MRRLAAILCLFCLTGEIQAGEPAGHHCMKQPDSRWVAHHLVAGRFNPLGMESTFRMGMCLPLITRPGLLFEYTHIEFGAVNRLSPAYTHLGGYVQISPLSFLKLRAELTGLVLWPFPFERAAYHQAEGYDASLASETYPSDDGESAFGWNLNLVAVLQVRAPLGGLSLVLYDQADLQYWKVGDQPFYVNLRRDLIAARTDWILSNEAFVVLEIPWSPTAGIRAGLYDSLDHLFESGHLTNHLGVVFMLYFLRHNQTAFEIEPFVRFGYYSDHPLRHGGITGFAGVSMGYDFGRP